ncbi:fibronectin type III domain-containing protein [Desertimonas flava]|uniref:fibronectin type III domain-containing protein n=1 Tax=Desertimonas flava TaxID=2064846 RepID=UPI000E34FF60|nr:fibronectin type III domain-containing protein [Desertimonas flava]
MILDRSGDGAWVPVDPYTWDPVAEDWVMLNAVHRVVNGALERQWPEPTPQVTGFTVTPVYSAGPDRYVTTLTWDTLPYSPIYRVEYRYGPEGGALGDWMLFFASTDPPPSAGWLLTGRMSYQFRIRATTFAGTGPWSNIVSFTTGPTKEHVGSPAISAAGLTYNATADRYEIDIHWSAPQFAETYDLEYRYNAGSGVSAWTPIEADTTANMRAMTGMWGQTLHEWRVRAKNPSGVSPWSATFALVTGMQKPYIAVTGGSWVNFVYRYNVTVSRPNVGPSRAQPGYYQVTSSAVSFLRHSNGTQPAGVVSTVNPRSGQTNAYSMTIGASGATPGIVYRFTCSFAATGRASVSDITTATQPAVAPPTVPTGVNGRFTSGRFVASWNAVTNAELYRVRVYRASDGVLIGETTTSSTSLAVGTAGQYAANAAYFCWVRAENDSGVSGWEDSPSRIKRANPLMIHATTSNTWRNGVWRNDADDIFQGYSPAGMNYGVYGYGNQFAALLSPSVIGYSVDVTLFQTFFYRRVAGAAGESLTGIYLHKQLHAGDGTFDTAIAGGHRQNAARNTIETFTLPNSWADLLIAGSYRGLCLWAPETNLVSGYGNVAPHYQINSRHTVGLSPNVNVGTCAIYHNG